MALISLIKFFRKMLRVYGGIAWAKAFSKISYPARERNLFFQLHIRLQTFSLTKENAIPWDHSTIAGKPKYFSKLFVAYTPEASKICCLSHRILTKED